MSGGGNRVTLSSLASIDEDSDQQVQQRLSLILKVSAFLDMRAFHATLTGIEWACRLAGWTIGGSSPFNSAGVERGRTWVLPAGDLELEWGAVNQAGWSVGRSVCCQ